ncbi:SAM-dependent methyltransferase [Clostridium botulinum]|nr:SAM-dependent methyltransferase [Clostridium botulinum]
MDAKLDKHHRFDWGVPPSSKGDWAFLLHMLASAARGGRIAAVAPHGVLFRRASEGTLRKKLLMKICWMPLLVFPRIFLWHRYSSLHPIFEKDRLNTDILFIDASNTDETGNLRYVKGKNQNELTEKHISDIVTAFYNRIDVPRFAHVATLDEIKENDYNLNIPRYVDTFEEEEIIDIEEIQVNIKKIKDELIKAEEQMSTYLKELEL